MELPEHKCGLYLTHNEHRDYYETLQEWLDGSGSHLKQCDWVSEEQRLKALATGEIWVLQWYPDTPVGFYIFCAADLDVLLAKANE